MRFFLAVLCLVPLTAQTAHVHADTAEKPASTLPPPVMIAGVGNSHLQITTASAEAVPVRLWALTPALLLGF